MLDASNFSSSFLVFYLSFQVFLKIIYAGVGPVSQSDVDMAHACDACIVGFNVRDPPAAISLYATQANIKVSGHFNYAFVILLLTLWIR